VKDIDRYVDEDLRLIEEHAPDLIVGDMRQSLAISSQVKRIPFLNIIGAQWSPYTSVEIEPLDPPLATVLSESIGNSIFKTFIATAGSVHHSIPVNVVRVKHGLPPLSWDARHIYSSGDYVAYPDIPEIIPTTNLPSHHSYLGPILWSPEIPLPEWWHELPEDRPVVYVNLGSSGRKDLLNEVLSGLSI
jgi:UDP:flavonoid glycosyltransferase YjiC (YdhE family)